MGNVKGDLSQISEDDLVADDQKIYYDQLNRMAKAFSLISNPVAREKMIELMMLSAKF